MLNEPPGPSIHARLRRETRTAVISAANVLECSMVLSSRFGIAGVERFDKYLTAAEIVTMPVDKTQLEGARTAWATFGRGNHPAKLNYGDCFAYALANHLDVPLLCIGTDFAQTDLTLVAV
jgi:ribonuclease VapC